MFSENQRTGRDLFSFYSQDAFLRGALSVLPYISYDRTATVLYTTYGVLYLTGTCIYSIPVFTEP